MSQYWGNLKNGQSVLFGFDGMCLGYFYDLYEDMSEDEPLSEHSTRFATASKSSMYEFLVENLVDQDKIKYKTQLERLAMDLEF